MGIYFFSCLLPALVCYEGTCATLFRIICGFHFTVPGARTVLLLVCAFECCQSVHFNVPMLCVFMSSLCILLLPELAF